MKWVFILFLALYAVALMLFLVGTFGWFGQGEDPASAVFLLPLGLPWNILGDRMGLGGLPVLVLAPAINLGALFWLWRR